MKLKILAIAFVAFAATSGPLCSILEAQQPNIRDGRFAGWRTDTLNRSIDLKEIISGGPPKDGIPAIERPNFVRVTDARSWLRDREPVIAIEVDGQARAYPLQILIWHEIVNDEINAIPIAVTFCPLCYSALAFDRRLDGRTLRFTSTMLSSMSRREAIGPSWAWP